MDLSAICRSLASLPLATVVSCALLAAPVLAASVPVESAGDVVGVVKSVQGSVFIERSGDATNPVPGSPVHVGDRLRTGTAGALGVSLRDGTLLAFGPDTAFPVEQFLFKPQRRPLCLAGLLLSGPSVYTSAHNGRIP